MSIECVQCGVWCIGFGATSYLLRASSLPSGVWGGGAAAAPGHTARLDRCVVEIARTVETM